ncbi:MAG: NAD-binding protein [Candidatus Eisenbacteria bacterium]|nr:NAD-binding protein [Candidatus Eisenbacteria bacterium]
MQLPARNTLAVVGAGPIGLEAAAAALDHGLDVHLFEQGEVGSHPLGWGHVRMFTPWRMNLGPHSRTHLEAAGWTAPDLDACPTGAELVGRYLEPLAKLAELKDRIHTHSQVVSIGRHGLLKDDLIGSLERAERPFRLLVRDQGGRENYIHAFAVMDASGVYATPNWAGTGGIPARSEIYLRPQLSYHLDDVLGPRREVYAGHRTMVIGGGPTAATTVAALAKLADEVPGTAVAWVTHTPAASLYAAKDDPLPERRALYEKARGFLAGAHPAVTHVGGAEVEGFEFNSATHRYRVQLAVGDQPRVEEVDLVIVNTGYGADDSLYRELQVHECFATRAPMKLATALLGAAAGDCLTTPVFGADVLANPEPRFYVLGHKSYGRNPDFLLETGYRQVEDVVSLLAKESRARVPA